MVLLLLPASHICRDHLDSVYLDSGKCEPEYYHPVFSSMENLETNIPAFWKDFEPKDSEKIIKLPKRSNLHLVVHNRLVKNLVMTPKKLHSFLWPIMSHPIKIWRHLHNICLILLCSPQELFKKLNNVIPRFFMDEKLG
jgi:hypothetical protein